MTATASQFRQVMGAFATGVTIVTTGQDGRYHGMTANAFASVSLDPELVLVCVEKTAHTYPYIEESGVFVVNILSEEQEELSKLFADKNMRKYHDLHTMEYRTGVTGAPVLDGSVAYVECRVVARHDSGDHTIFIGQVEQAAMGEDHRRPLLFYRRRYRRLADHPF